MSNANNVNYRLVAGIALVALGIVGLLLSVFISMVSYASELDNGALPAVSFFIVSLGVAFYFPDLLQDERKNLSTMRVVVFMVVSIFCIVAIKIGWQARTFDEFTIDSTWVYILGLGFGSKVFQKFSEDNRNKGT
jgi:uncharacterized membrane protein